jgi:hypothetical protein
MRALTKPLMPYPSGDFPMAAPITTSSSDPSYESARRGLVHHAIIFAVMITLLAAFDWYTGEPYWVQWVFLGWGAGLALHALLVHRRH